MSDEAIPDAWRDVLNPVLASAEARALGGWLRAEEAAGKTIYPPRGQRLTALALTAPQDAKVVILGQDPYHGPGQAMGLAFSVPDGERVPPSLRNIYTELETDCGIAPPASGDLRGWARQGVLLLNTTLTVERGRAASHAGKGWDAITDACVAAIAERTQPAVFILWGAHAQKKAGRIAALDSDRHCVIESPHPSPLSARRGFFGSKPFSRTNDFLQDHGRSVVDWSL